MSKHILCGETKDGMQCTNLAGHDSATQPPNYRRHYDHRLKTGWDATWKPVRLRTGLGDSGMLTEAFCPDPDCAFRIIQIDGRFTCGSCDWVLPQTQVRLVDAQLCWQLTGMWHPAGVISPLTYPPTPNSPYSIVRNLKRD